MKSPWVKARKLGIPSRYGLALAGLLMLIATAFRFMMSVTLHMWYAYTQVADDALLMSYSFDDYFSSTDYYKLAKNQAYGYFLRFVSWSGINIDIVYFLVWLIAAILMSIAMYRLFSTLWISMASYIYILWNPIAFESWQGTRVYRNSLLTPVLFILVALLVVFLTFTIPRTLSTAPAHASAASSAYNRQHVLHLPQLLRFSLLGIIIGLLFTFIYDLKEDSVWLVPMFVFVLGVKSFMVARTSLPTSKKVGIVLLCILPAFVSFLGLQTLKFCNYRNFGAYQLNTRCSGEIAGFVYRIYKIDSPHQNPIIWAPADSIEKAESVSPTLRSEPSIIQYVETRDFAFPNIRQNPLKGDFVTWQMLPAIADTKMGMKDEKPAQLFFAQVNREIDEAFNDGRLKKTDKISIAPSLVPRTPAQITEMLKPSWNMFLNSFILMTNYTVTYHRNTPTYKADTVADPEGLEQLNIDPMNPNPTVIRGFSFSDAQNVARNSVRVYRIINVLLALILICSFAAAVRGSIRGDSRKLALYGLSLCLIAYGFVYSFFVYWFVQYVGNDYVQFFYTTGPITPLLCTGLLLGLGMCCFLTRKQHGTVCNRQSHDLLLHTVSPHHRYSYRGRLSQATPS